MWRIREPQLVACKRTLEAKRWGLTPMTTLVAACSSWLRHCGRLEELDASSNRLTQPPTDWCRGLQSSIGASSPRHSFRTWSSERNPPLAIVSSRFGASTCFANPVLYSTTKFTSHGLGGRRSCCLVLVARSVALVSSRAVGRRVAALCCVGHSPPEEGPSRPSRRRQERPAGGRSMLQRTRQRGRGPEARRRGPLWAGVPHEFCRRDAAMNTVGLRTHVLASPW